MSVELVDSEVTKTEFYLVENQKLSILFLVGKALL